MMQLLQQQALQSPGGFAFGRIEAGLGRQACRIESGLCKQLTETGNFDLKNVLLDAFGRHDALDLRDRWLAL
jgi:hypothetical protein